LFSSWRDFLVDTINQIDKNGCNYQLYAMTTETSTASDPLAVQRVRYPVHVRSVQVQQVHRTSPHLMRIRFVGEALHGFVSASFDDHIKFMLPPDPLEPLVLPMPGPDGLALPVGALRPVMRDYTPRWFDAEAGLLDIEFALHGGGFAAAWAAQAQPGQQAGIGGPRGSFVVPPGFDWHLLVGDETALPAIARRLEELPAGTQALVIAETADPADRRVLESRARLQVQWLTQAVDGGLAQAVAQLRLPAGEGYAWAAGEAADMAAARRALVQALGMSKDRVRASAYWKRGASAHHETL
jgi:NADPH-dependent ferric siderophore reductase